MTTALAIPVSKENDRFLWCVPLRQRVSLGDVAIAREVLGVPREHRPWLRHQHEVGSAPPSHITPTACTTHVPSHPNPTTGHDRHPDASGFGSHGGCCAAHCCLCARRGGIPAQQDGQYINIRRRIRYRPRRRSQVGCAPRSITLCSYGRRRQVVGTIQGAHTQSGEEVHSSQFLREGALLVPLFPAFD